MTVIGTNSTPSRLEREVAPGLEGAAGIAGEDLLQRDALFRVGAVVDQKAELAVLLEDVALPMDDEDNGEILGELEVAVVAFADQPGEHALAKSVGRIGAEIAGAADGAIAQVPPVAGDAPVGNCIGRCRRSRGRIGHGVLQDQAKTLRASDLSGKRRGIALRFWRGCQKASRGPMMRSFLLP